MYFNIRINWQLLIYVTQLKYLGTTVTNSDKFSKTSWEYEILEIRIC
jgi:hypothetical protein